MPSTPISITTLDDPRVGHYRKLKDKVLLMATGGVYEVTRLGVFSPEMVDRPELGAGEVGFLVAGIKKLEDAKVGDTITHKDRVAAEPLPGFREVKPMVFSGVYPIDSAD